MRHCSWRQSDYKNSESDPDDAASGNHAFLPKKMIYKLVRVLLSVALLVLLSAPALTQQIADPRFNAKVESPAFSKNFPRVLFDEAHNNVDTTTGRYKPFADLLFNDGFHLAVNRQPFTKASLQTFKILVIVNPLGAEDADEDGADGPAFTAAECAAVSDWLRGGGALLFVADQAPFAAAAEVLAQKLGIDLGKGQTTDPQNAAEGQADPSVIAYSRLNQLLGDHAILNGRSEAERISRVVVFSGESLKGPEGSELLFKVGDAAVDKFASPAREVSARGRAQGLALRLGKGRVVALGDAAMLSAQLTGSDNQPFGMNIPGSDNRQLALNIMHWLAGLLK
jgi:hypothetical protein